jgi:hypothetical protein
MQLRDKLGAFAFALVLLIVSTASSFASTADDAGGLLWYLLFGGGAIGGAAAVGVKQRLKKAAIRAQLKELKEIGRTSAEPDRDVNVTVFAPATAPPRAEVVIQAFVHLPDLESEVHAISFGADPSSIKLASIPLALQLKRNDRIKVSLEASGGAAIEEPILHLRWNGKLALFAFEARLPDSAVEIAIRFKLRVFANGVPAGTIIFNVGVKPGADTEPAKRIDQQSKRFNRPFLSYASQDRAKVLRAAQLLRALKMEFFQDLLALEPGDRWRERLFLEIDKCDLFLLFWSQNARNSSWVTREAEYALRRSRTSPIEIVPVLLEGPPAIPPPPSLEEIHFNDALQHVILAEESAAQQSLPLVGLFPEKSELRLALFMMVGFVAVFLVAVLLIRALLSVLSFG